MELFIDLGTLPNIDVRNAREMRYQVCAQRQRRLGAGVLRELRGNPQAAGCPPSQEATVHTKAYPGYGLALVLRFFNKIIVLFYEGPYSGI